MPKLKTNFDHPWKDSIEPLFRHMIRFVSRKLYREIDWRVPPVFLDKELKQLMRQEKIRKGRRHVDKLVRVTLKSGATELLLIHLEIQNEKDDQFPKRMYVYHYRLFDKYEERIFSMAILGDLNQDWRPSTFEYDQHGCRVRFEFPIIKLIDYEAKLEQLEASHNPFALMILAHLMAKRTVSDQLIRAKWKEHLILLAHQKRLPVGEKITLLRFYDWILLLPATLDKKIDQEVQKKLGGEPMTLKARWEIRAEKRGEKRGKELGKELGKEAGALSLFLEMVRDRFGEIPTYALEKIQSAKPNLVTTWAKVVYRKDSIDELLAVQP